MFLLFAIVSSVLAVLLFAVNLRIFYLYDTLIKHEYESFRSHWEQDGRPNGLLYWKAPQGDALQSGTVQQQLRKRWSQNCPEWIKNSPELFKRYREIQTLSPVSFVLGILALPGLIYFITQVL